MRHTLKTYFIPHAENNYHPHMLHTKRAVFYGAFFVSLKIIVFLFALALPARVFVLPDVLAQEQKKIIALTNDVRAQKGLEPLAEIAKLGTSSQSKADDMAKYSYFSHVSPEQKTVSDWIKASGYSYKFAGENLAMGFSTASDVVNAWIKSPTHYANLIDADFLEIGVGMQTGQYADIPTVYVAQHFGQPTVQVTPASTPAPKVIVPTPKTVTLQLAEPEQVLAVKEEVSVLPALTYHDDQSRLYWQDHEDGTLLTAYVKMSGLVRSAVVTVGTHEMELTTNNDEDYRSSLVVSQSSDDLFRVITPASIHITGADGREIQSQLNWYNVKVVSPTPVETYVRSKDSLSPLTSIFSITRGIYIFGIIFFSLALILSIFIEFKKQHPHIILQTGGLLSLLVLLMVI